MTHGSLATILVNPNFVKAAVDFVMTQNCK